MICSDFPSRLLSQLRVHTVAWASL